MKKSIIPALGRLRQEDPEFETALSYNLSLNNNNKKKTQAVDYHSWSTVVPKEWRFKVRCKC